MQQIKYVICTRHYIHLLHSEHNYDTYERTDGDTQVIAEKCTWQGAKFLSKEEAIDTIAEAFKNNEDKYAQMVFVTSLETK